MFSKDLQKFNENDLREIEKISFNLEDLQVEFKFKYDNNSDELRRDVIQFANNDREGYIFYGVQEDPLKIVGLERKDIDNLKIHLNNVLPRKIDPVLSPFPMYKIIELANGKFVFCIKIFPKERGIYAIRLSDNPSNSKFNVYEFYKRLDGSKHQLKIEEVVELIESKSTGSKKLLEVSIHPTALTDIDLKDVFITIKAVNKSVRPIVVMSYGLYIVKEGYIYFIIANSIPNRYLCDRLPKKLLDGEACQALISRKYFEQEMKNNKWKYPLEVKVFFDTNDGRFYSDSIELKDYYKPN